MTKLTRMLSVVISATILLTGYLPAAFGHEVSLSCPAAFGPVPDASGLIAYYPLDGNTADVSGNGMDAIEVNAAEPAEGKLGQGYYFNGKDSFIRLPPDISPYAYPQITITAWIKPEVVNGARYIVNQGDHGNIGLFMSNGAVSAGSTAPIGNPKHTVYAGRWAFVALTYDHTTGAAVLLSNSTLSTFDQVVVPELPRPSVLLGAKAPGNSVFAGVIDEVRIYNRALTTTELAGLKNSMNTPVMTNDSCADVSCPSEQVCWNGGCFDDANSTNTPVMTNSGFTEAGAYPPTDVFASSSAGDSVGDAASPYLAGGSSAQSDIRSYGDNPLPDNESSGSGSTAPLQGGLIAERRNTNMDLSGVSRPDLGPSLEGSACSIILPASSGGSLAGRWQSFSSTDGDLAAFSSTGGDFAATVDFYGPDSNLSGHIWLIASTTFGQIDADEALSSISLTDSTVRFSGPTVGEVVGEVSGDGSKITAGDLVLERVACGSEFAASSGDSGPGNVMAGYWLRSESPGAGFSSSESTASLEFMGPDSVLSGHLVIQVQVFGMQIDEEDPLTNIVKNGLSISFSSALLGNMTGEVSDDGTEMTLSLGNSLVSDSTVFSKQ